MIPVARQREFSDRTAVIASETMLTVPLTLAIDGSVATISLNRPEVMNAIDSHMLQALEESLDASEMNGNVRVLIIAGLGDKAFCAGADIKHVRSIQGAEKRHFIEHAYRVLERIASSPLASIAAVHGFALGGGLELAMACDLRIADESATFGLPEMTLGSVPSFGAVQRLPLLVGYGVATELLMTGRRLRPDEARQCGLVNQVVAKGGALSAARQMAAALSLRPAEALRYAKLAIRHRVPAEFAAAFHALVSEVCHNSPGYESNTQKFLNSNK